MMTTVKVSPADKTSDAEQALARAELFSGVGHENMKALARPARFIDLGARETLVRSEESSRGIYLIESGLLKLTCYAPRRIEKVVALLDAGKTFGQAELFADKRFKYEILAIRKSRLVLVPGHVVKTVSRRDADLAQNLLECLGRQFDALIRDIAGSAALNASQRVVAYLLSRSKSESGSPVKIHLPVTKVALAARLGIAQETLSRTLSVLQSERLIDVRHRDITIHDRAALEMMLDADGVIA